MRRSILDRKGVKKKLARTVRARSPCCPIFIMWGTMMVCSTMNDLQKQVRRPYHLQEVSGRRYPLSAHNQPLSIWRERWAEIGAKLQPIYVLWSCNAVMILLFFHRLIMRSKNNPLKALDVSLLQRLSNSMLVSCQKFVHLLSWSIVAELEWGRYCGGAWGLRGLEGNGMVRP